MHSIPAGKWPLSLFLALTLSTGSALEDALTGPDLASSLVGMITGTALYFPLALAFSYGVIRLRTASGTASATPRLVDTPGRIAGSWLFVVLYIVLSRVAFARLG